MTVRHFFTASQFVISTEADSYLYNCPFIFALTNTLSSFWLRRSRGQKNILFMPSIYGKRSTNVKPGDGRFLCVAASMFICLTRAVFCINGPQRKSESCSLRPPGERSVVRLFMVTESICQHDLIK